MYKFKQIETIAAKYGLILEKVGKKYELTSNSQGTTAVCKNLSEVLIEIGCFMASGVLSDLANFYPGDFHE